MAGLLLPKTRHAVTRAGRVLADQRALPVYGPAWPDHFPYLIERMQDQYRNLREEGRRYGDQRFTDWIDRIGDDPDVVEVRDIRNAALKRGEAWISPLVHIGRARLYRSTIGGTTELGEYVETGIDYVEEPQNADPRDCWLFIEPSRWAGQEVIGILTAYWTRWETEIYPGAEELAKVPHGRLIALRSDDPPAPGSNQAARRR